MVIKNILVHQKFTANQKEFVFNISSVSGFSNKYKRLTIKNVAFLTDISGNKMFILRCKELQENLFTFHPENYVTICDYSIDISTKLLSNNLTFEIFEMNLGDMLIPPVSLAVNALLSFQLEFNTE
jgi:hypothetical protein